MSASIIVGIEGRAGFRNKVRMIGWGCSVQLEPNNRSKDRIKLVKHKN